MTLLEVTGLTKSFAGIRALDHVTTSLGEGEVVGLIGPNGAGKTTLFDCVAGLVEPDSGEVTFSGQPLGHLPAYRRSRLGIARTFQRLQLFSGMTPREHLQVTERVRSGSGRFWKDIVGLGRPSRSERRRADELLELVGLEDAADVPVDALSLGEARLVELARALAGSPRLLMLDEPSSGLDEQERSTLSAAATRVHRLTGCAVLMVEHDLELVGEICERLVVLDSGRLVADGPLADVLAEETVQRAYMGAR